MSAAHPTGDDQDVDDLDLSEIRELNKDTVNKATARIRSGVIKPVLKPKHAPSGISSSASSSCG